MKAKTQNSSLEIAQCYMLLADCISFNHIEDDQFILNNLEYAKDLYRRFADDFRSEIEEFINTTILPIVENSSYFSFLHKTEYGSYNENGNFEINSEESLDMIIAELYHHTITLNEKLLKLFAKYI